MTLLVDLADVLRAAGLNVIELPGWKTRGEDGPFTPIGILLHHDGMALGFNKDPDDDLNVPKNMSQNGVNGSQLWAGEAGEIVVMAAGRKDHAGEGKYPGIPGSGNTFLLGIETDHTDGTPWTAALMDTIYRASKALKEHYGYSADLCIGHLEWAPGRKHDPSDFDLNAWRAYLRTPTPTPAPTDGDLDMSDISEITNRLDVINKRLTTRAKGVIDPDTKLASSDIGDAVAALLRAVQDLTNNVTKLRGDLVNAGVIKK